MSRAEGSTGYGRAIFTLGVMVAVAMTLTATPASALYIHVGADGQIHLSSTPLGPDYLPVFQERTSAVESGETERDVLEEVASERGTPLIFLQSIVETLEEREEGRLLLPPTRVEQLGDSVAENPRENVEHGITVLESLLREHRRNLTVVLGKYYMSDEFEELGGIPSRHAARGFVNDVQNRLDELRNGDPILYSYVDEDGRRQILSIR